MNALVQSHYQQQDPIQGNQEASSLKQGIIAVPMSLEAVSRETVPLSRRFFGSLTGSAELSIESVTVGRYPRRFSASISLFPSDGNFHYEPSRRPR